MCLFIFYGAFLLLKIVKNYQKWVSIGMGGFFLLRLKSCLKEQQNTLLNNYALCFNRIELVVIPSDIKLHFLV